MEETDDYGRVTLFYDRVASFTTLPPTTADHSLNLTTSDTTVVVRCESRGRGCYTLDPKYSSPENLHFFRH